MGNHRKISLSDVVGILFTLTIVVCLAMGQNKQNMNTELLNETELANDYPVYWDYLYVADGKVIRSDVKGTVLNLKRDLKSQGISCNVITNCDIEGRRKQLNNK